MLRYATVEIEHFEKSKLLPYSLAGEVIDTANPLEDG